MRRANVEIGKKYRAKVAGKQTIVIIDAKNLNGGWDATNMYTGRAVRIKTAVRLTPFKEEFAVEEKRSA